MILVLTPLALEHSALNQALEGTPNLQVLIGGHGKVQFALSTQLLIQKYEPKLVICAGAAGALIEDLNPGDIVVGEHTIEHDYNLRFISRPLPEFPAHLTTLETLKRRQNNIEVPIHFGRLASGDEDIMDQERAQAVRKLTDAIAVAWEGAGGARAAKLHNVPFIEIRAITDGADLTAARDFKAHIQSSMKNLAEVIKLLL